MESSNYYGFLINSGIHPFIQKRPQLLKCQVQILVSDYPALLSQDSYIDCSKLFPFSNTEIQRRQLIKSSTKDEMQRVVDNTAQIEDRFKSLIVDN